MAPWDVIDLQIHSVGSEPSPPPVHVDSKMQVPVYISLKANIKGTIDRYYLTEDELEAIELFDFDTNDQLSGSWSYSDADLSNIPPETLADSVSNQDQLKCFWVSSTKPEDKMIAARIRQPDGRLVTTQMGTGVHFTTFADTTTTTLKVINDVIVCGPLSATTLWKDEA